MYIKVVVLVITFKNSISFIRNNIACIMGVRLSMLKHFILIYNYMPHNFLSDIEEK